MPMQLLSCEIVLGGDDKNTVVRGPSAPVTYPEMLVIAAIHGKEHVRDIRYVGEDDRENAEERDRLARIYGEQVVARVFPGDHVPLPEGDPRLVKRAAKANPKPTPAETSAE